MSNASVSSQEFERLIQPFLPLGKIVAVAVSGGADSMALAFCLKRFVKDGGQLLAFIVEHGLREESAAEAKTVAARLTAMGIETEILPWHHGAIASRIHVRARDARYALLTEACKRRGASTLFLAHHADDQAETVLMRLSKGSGVDGLAGMAPAVDMDGVRLVRPFLSVPKVQLVATCAENAIETVTDPSNEKEKYARGRLRRVMPLLAAEGLTPERLVDLADRAREAKEALDFYTQDYLRGAAQLDASGAITLDVPTLVALPRAVALRALATCLRTLHPTDYPPEREALGAFYQWIIHKNTPETRSFHGCLAHKNDGKQTVTFLRELAAITDKLPITTGETVLWDGRWRVTLHGAESGLIVRALGAQNYDVQDSLSPDLRRKIASGRRRMTLPALWRGDVLVAVPSFNQTNQVVASALLVVPFWAKESA